MNREASTVFQFFADPANDPLWRSEINRVVVHGTLQRGVKISEYSKLSGKLPDHLLHFECVDFAENAAIIFETVPGSAFYQRSERNTEALSNGTTRVCYKVSFDRSIVKFALGITLPQFVITWKARNDGRKYLRKLRSALETSIL